MINFANLKLDKRTNSNNLDPFIGIRKNINGEIEFRLPVGFDNFPEKDFNAIKQLFFRMYRTFKKFEQDNFNYLQQNEKSTNKDNIEVGGNAYQFKDKEGNDVILYSKISVIERMLETYKDLALDVIERKIGRNENIDFSKIDQYLHKAIYLDDDVIYVDEMDLARQTLQHKSTNIIELFCFILFELQQELEQTVEKRVNELANKFREQHLTHDQSLFNEETFEITILYLKEILDEIDKQTIYKDDDYWQLYEAIETFLYGELDMENTHEEGIFWGMSNFYQIWEDMCNTYAFKNFYNILYADTNILFKGKPVANHSYGGHHIFVRENFENPFFIEFLGNKRWMRPDCLHKISIFDKNIKIIKEKTNSYSSLRCNFTVRLLNKNDKRICNKFIFNLKQALKRNKVRGARNKSNNEFVNYPIQLLNEQKDLINKNLIILDWKYHDYNFFLSHSEKLKKDIIKQLSYEFALQQKYKNPNRIQSQFVIPYFYPNEHNFKNNDDIGDFIEDCGDSLKNNEIQLFQANFIKLQQIYLSET